MRIKHQVLYGHGDPDNPYMERWVIGRLRIHKFYRGDIDPDPHDHPFDFWTFPLSTYVEDVYYPMTGFSDVKIVKRWRWHKRQAEHVHRVLGAWSGDDEYTGFEEPQVRKGTFWTIVWTGKPRRNWGFWIGPIWIHWERYVNGDKRLWVD